MKNFKSHFAFNKQERSGIFFLLLIIVLLQGAYFVYTEMKTEDVVSQVIVDSDLQKKIDALKNEALKKEAEVRLYPFNPNFISDYKGYELGMSTVEIDRLHRYRNTNKYVNSAEEFQKVTQVSDSLLARMVPYFKFPVWVKKRTSVGRNKSTEKIKALHDLNAATAEELRSVYGIGTKLSERIVKFRNRLGGFLIDEQLYDVYGLDKEVVARALKRFTVKNPPIIHKININTASAKELSKLVYIQKNLAIDIINYRNDKKMIKSFDELTKIKNFPINQIDRITLYLSL